MTARDWKYPNLKPYLSMAALLILGWLGYCLYTADLPFSQELPLEALGEQMKTGTLATLSAVLLVFLTHSMTRCIAAEIRFDNFRLAEMTESIREADRLRTKRFDLEIRGAGLAVDGDHQSEIWKLIKKKRSNFTSIFSSDPDDYQWSMQSRGNLAAINRRVAFRHSARDGVAYWPIPTFALGPPARPDNQSMAASLIQSGRNAATLGVTLFVCQKAENTLHAQGMIQDLFGFMEKNQDVPQALIVSRDGDVVRNLNRPRGTPGLTNGKVVPTVFDTVTGLLVSRSVRLEYLRSRALNDPENNQDKNSLLGKFWYFYWQQSRNYDAAYKAELVAAGIDKPHANSSGTPSSEYWHRQLERFMRANSDNRAPYFSPTQWLPLRWARHQISEFDAAPLLGHLHRPITVSMRNAEGALLKPAQQAKRLASTWTEALETLPTTDRPVRVFYDSTGSLNGVIALTQALNMLNTDEQGLDLNNVDEGYDIGRRLGQTGVSSALVQINLATIASYLDGGISAVVYTGADASVTVQMIRPPSADAIARNTKTRGADPFTYGAPGRR